MSSLIQIFIVASLFSFGADQRLKFLRDLESKGKLRVVTCREFSSSILTRFGLPALGAQGAVKGQRHSVDRQAVGKNPPIFRDGLTLPNSKDTVGIIAAHQGAQWQLTVEREIFLKSGVLKARSVFVFSAKSREDAICELQNIDFSLNAKPKPLPQLASSAGSFDGLRCVDFLMEKKAALQAAIHDINDMASAVVVEDCQRGLSYFADIKKKLVDVRKGKRR